jgi:5-methylcytosine-specific restriction endonuclease McrA
VLNANGRPLTIVSWQRAIVLVHEGRMLEMDFYKNEKIKDGHGRYYTIPAVVMRKNFVKRNMGSAPFCKKNVYLRDSLQCQYCGKTCDAKELTFDHVIPRSKWADEGSPTRWENIVTACRSCNNRKADKSCKEAKMFPIKQPVRPSHGEMFLGLSPWKDRVPEEWTPYLSTLPAFKGVTNVQKIENEQ